MEFRDCHDLGSIATKLVELERHILFPLVYRIIELALILPVVIVSIENGLFCYEDYQNVIALNDLMVCYIE